jgi:hypothetical protein
VTDRSAKLNVALTKVSLAGFAPYLAQFVVPGVEGQLDTTAQLDWSGAADAPRLQLVVPAGDARRAALREGKGRTALDGCRCSSCRSPTCASTRWPAAWSSAVPV